MDKMGGRLQLKPGYDDEVEDILLPARGKERGRGGGGGKGGKTHQAHPRIP